jgi:hypothetical protein
MTITANTLSDKKVFANFLDCVKKHSPKWQTQSIKARSDFLQQSADWLTQTINIPRIRVDTTSKNLGGLFNLGEFRPEYIIYLNNKRVPIKNLNEARLADSTSVENDFYKVALQLYHEVRHAEQFIRGVQYYYQNATNEEKANLGFSPESGVFSVSSDPTRANAPRIAITPTAIIDRLKNPLLPSGFLKLPTGREPFAKRMLVTVHFPPCKCSG